MLVVGLTVMLTAFAVTLSYQDIGAVVSGQVVDPVTPAVMDAFGAWAERPFVAVVLIAFVACVVSVQTYIGRAIFGMARDAILPAPPCCAGSTGARCRWRRWSAARCWPASAWPWG